MLMPWGQMRRRGGTEEKKREGEGGRGRKEGREERRERKRCQESLLLVCMETTKCPTAWLSPCSSKSNIFSLFAGFPL